MQCHVIFKAGSRFAPSQWETALPCNDVSHWLGASLESALILDCFKMALNCTCIWCWNSLQNKCRTTDPDRQNLGRSGKLSFFILYKFWQNCASVRQVSDLILKTAGKVLFEQYCIGLWRNVWLISVFRPISQNDHWCQVRWWQEFGVWRHKVFRFEMINSQYCQVSTVRLTSRCLSGKLWYLQQNCVGDILVYH